MKRLQLLFIYAICYLNAAVLFGQISDNFSDGNFDQNPAWQGDAANFIVNPAGELQLNAAAAGSSALALQGNFPASTTWDVRFRLAFSPSTSNLLRIYLLADQFPLTNANGYFIEIGETGSADALRLYRQTGATNTLLGTGTAGFVATNPDINLHITRSLSGQWTVEAAVGTGALMPQFTATDATYPAGLNSFFAVQCTYTVSNINKYFFDDLLISQGPPDTDPPAMLSVVADNELQITAVFNESLNPTSAANVANYTISNGIGQPATASLLPDGVSVQLGLSTSLTNGNYMLQSSGVQDASGNPSNAQSLDFEFFKTDVAEEFDVLINEIMADQTPSQGLPEVEWLELFNRSAKIIDLSTLRIKDATGNPIVLPAYILNPGSYVALVSEANESVLQAATTGKVLGIAMSSSTLNNDGDELTLSDASGNTIDRVAYSINWHTDFTKQEGGWSLERVNPGLPCIGEENWVSCPASIGGTPALPNASLSTVADQTAPKFLKVLVESPTSLLITFSEGIETIAAENAAAYTISPNRAILSADQITNNRAQVRLTLTDPLEFSTVYTLSGAASLADCSGNGLATAETLILGLAELPGRYEVIINEIMPKPQPSVGMPTVEWFELLNRSNKIIDLASMRVQDQSGSPVVLPSYLLLPGEYVAVCALANVAALQTVAMNKVVGATISASLLNDDGDALLLTAGGGQVIDRVAYTSAWHTEKGKQDGGWSLERINYDLPCLGSENWQSCPLLPGATPGAVNAAYQNTTDEKDPHVLWGYPETAYSVLLTFGEGLDPVSLSNVDAFQFNPPIAVSSAVVQPTYNQILLILSEPLIEGTAYKLTVTNAIQDCSGNEVTGQDTIVVGLPQEPEVQDILINEIMFNPATGNARYVEFYNNSDKIFDWGQLYIARFSDVDSSSARVDEKRLCIPGEYYAFSPSPSNIRETFQNIIQRNVMDEPLPSYDDKSDNVTLYWVKNLETVIIDDLDYSDDWHNALYSIGDRDGIALERIRTDLPTNDGGNWISASPILTGAPGTPTLPNSQRQGTANPADQMINVDPARLSPDDDGYEDFLDIQYQIPEVGYAATIRIFDADGNKVKTLEQQELLGTSGALRWDGEHEDRSRARPGIYILSVELVSPRGETQRVKKVFAVVAKK